MLCSLHVLQRRLSHVTLKAFVSRSSVPRFYATTATDVRPPLTEFSEDEVMLRKTVREFAVHAIHPHVRRMDEEEKVDKKVLTAMFDEGLMGIEIDSEYGGSDMNFCSSIIVIEELAKVCPGISAICDVQNTLINNAIKNWASKSQKAELFPLLASNTLGSFCLSEAGSGSDAFALRCKAERDGDHFILNGSKLWISNAAEAGLFVIFANTDTVNYHYKGITAFVVPASYGIKVSKKEKKLGIRASSTCELQLDNVRVPASCLLGDVGKGYKVAISVLNEGRIGIASQMVGLAQGAFDVALPYINQRKQFNTIVADFQGLQHQYAQIRTEIEAARLLVYNAARLRDSGKPFVAEAAMAKLFACQVAERAASKAIEWMGGVGYTRDYMAEKFYRDAKVGSIYEGTSNMLLQTIAKIVQQEYRQK